MENPWFGRKGNGYTGGPVTWQGWLATFGGFGGALACHAFLPHPLNNWAAAGCIVALLIVYFLTYDPDTESW